MSILITGGSSYLGRHLTVRAAERFRVFTTYHRHPGRIRAGERFPLALTDRAAVMGLVQELAPQAIIHVAAVNPGGDEPNMRRVNVEGSRYIAEAAVAVGARLVYVSTDVVHSGRDAPYADEAAPSPLNPYGHSKAAAEAAIAEVDPGAVIVRTSLIYGLEEIDRGTVGFVKRLESGEPLTLFNDVIRQPIWVETLSEALLKLVDLDLGGILNVAGRQALTREAFGRRMLAWWGIVFSDLIGSGRAADISDIIPLDLRMSVAKGGRLLQMPFPGVDDVLAMHQPTNLPSVATT